ncbi:diguanylate cyclase [Shimia thalassica]|uniref:diguanylate cyclase domain-containing protein n=1 Tax=Shimia thalassica TaxID=1715693 RepID=UPI002735E4B6|nr:diguanylate cyclase [Shimia thalassica]MDP2579378.1 diguanylate cyclase [Shimia thalassica]
MPGKILVLDSVPTNRIVLKVKLSSAFYSVSQACTLKDAISHIRQDPPDLIVLCAENCSDGGGIEQCRTLARIRPGLPIPILVLTSEMTRSLRLTALSAGAEDILQKPIHDQELNARIRAILRAREASEELRLRERTTRALGFSEQARPEFERRAQVIFVSQDGSLGLRWRSRLKPLVPYAMQHYSPKSALKEAPNATVADAFVIAIDPNSPDEGLRFLAEIRAHTGNRHCGVLVVLQNRCDRSLIDALDLGANAIMAHGFDAEEMALRLATIIKQKRLREKLDRTVHDGLQAAVTDPLTGLFNRRYALHQLGRMISQSRHDQRDMAVMVADLDHFKRINDRYGHAVGDEVLRQMADRMRAALRSTDLIARIGGEEFLIVLPFVATSQARRTAETLCETVRHSPVILKGRDLQVNVTMSIGMGMVSDLPRDLANHPDTDVAGILLDQADQALYGAKATGRDQVTFRQSTIRPASGMG